MKNTKSFKLLFIYMVLTFSLYSKVTVYEDADTSSELKGNWTSNTGSSLKRVYNESRGSGVVSGITMNELDNSNLSTLYRLKIVNNKDNAIQWDINMTSSTAVYVKLRTKTKINGKIVNTYRYIEYYPVSNSKTKGLTKGGYIWIGIGKEIANHKWHTIRRDLIHDLKKYDPASELVSIEEFLVRGNARLDNIETMSYRQYEDGTGIRQFPSEHNKKNYQKIENWYAFENDQDEAEITSVYDEQLDKKVVSLKAADKNFGFAMRKGFDEHKNYTTIQWDMKYEEAFTVYVKVNTKDGIRYLSYVSSKDKNYTHKLLGSDYLYIGLGKESINNEWHTYTRDLQKDLQKFDEDNKVLEVNAFLIRGSGLINNIFLLESTDVDDDPIYAHKHYYMDTSALSLNGQDLYTLRLSERHTAEEGLKEAIVLYQKSKNSKKWKEKILLRGKKGNAFSANISPIRIFENNVSKILKDKIFLRTYTRVRGESNSATPETHIYIYDIKKETLSKPITLKLLERQAITYGNTLITPEGKILIAGYSGEDNATAFIYRSEELFDLDKRSPYTMEIVKRFEEPNESATEAVLSYSFGKLTIAIRKDVKWYDVRAKVNEEGKLLDEKEILENINGEVYYTDNLEGEKDSKWTKKVLPVQINGMYIPPYQKNYYLMIASDGGNRQKIITLNEKSSLSNIDNVNKSRYNMSAWTINHPLGGGYAGYIHNDKEAILIYWEETNDKRKTKIIRSNFQ